MQKFISFLLISFVFSAFLFNNIVIAQEMIPSKSLTPIEEILKPDGTIDAEKKYSGSVDPKGWNMYLGVHGEPHFTQAQSVNFEDNKLKETFSNNDQYWGTFPINPNLGADGPIYTVLVVSENEIYVGGRFNSIGGTSGFNNIAKWTGTYWREMSGGITGTIFGKCAVPEVRALAKSGDDLYVGGCFANAGSINAKCIARFDTYHEIWYELSGNTSYHGVYGKVNTIAIDGNDICVGGEFESPRHFLARWSLADGWKSFVPGSAYEATNFYVNVIKKVGGDIFVGGYFSGVAGSNGTIVSGTEGIARWSIYNQVWVPLANGINTNNNFYGVHSIETVAGGNTIIYVGGDFSEVKSSSGTTINAKRIAKYDGSWHQLGADDNNNGADYVVRGIKYFQGKLFVGGDFNTVGGSITANHIAAWDNGSSTWSSLGSGSANGANGDVYSVDAGNNKVYLVGTFSQANGMAWPHLAVWNGTNWDMGKGPNQWVEAIAVSGSNVYVGGSFSKLGELPFNHIARWDGSSWQAMGNGTNYSVGGIATQGNNVYIVGDFTSVDGIPANGVAKWNGTTWSALGSGLTGNIYNWGKAIAISNSDVYVGGKFTTAGGVSATNLAKWNGTSWSAVSGGTNGEVWALAIKDNNLYVGGTFTQAGSISVNNIALYNGSTWSNMNQGVISSWYDTRVRCIVIDDYNSVFVSGHFDHAGGSPINQIAKWDGTGWSSIGNAIDRIDWDVYSIALSGNSNNLYMTGCFAVVGGKSAFFIARWNGVEWFPLGSGLNQFGHALGIQGNNVYVGGDFSRVAGQPSNFFARWNEPIPSQTSPSNGASFQTCSANLIWTSIANVQYHVQVSTSPLFESGSLEIDMDNLTTTTYNYSSPFSQGTHYWRVAVSNPSESGDDGPWSDTRTFSTVTCPPTVGVPNGQTNVSVGPVLYWSAISGATSYSVRVATDANMTNIIRSYTNLPAPQRTIYDLSFSTDYWFQAQAFKGSSATSWSSPNGHFVTQADPGGGGGGGGGGCPYVATWNGEQYIKDNNILPQSEYAGYKGGDVTDHYKILQPLEMKNNQYSVEIQEFEQENSSLNQFSLIAIDHSKETKIALRNDNSIVEYSTPFELSIMQNSDVEETGNLKNIDNSFIPIRQGNELPLIFNPIGKENLPDNVTPEYGLVMAGKVSRGRFTTNTGGGGGKIDKVGEISTGTNSRQRNSSFTFRERTTLAYVPLGNRDEVINLKFIENVDLDYVDLALEVPSNYTTHELRLISAIHSKDADVTYKLNETDAFYTSLVPGESIELNYEAPPLVENMKRDFVLISHGKYEKILADNNVKPASYQLMQNHPNPFNPTTEISYSLPEDQQVILKVYDMVGREVATLVNEMQSVGNKTVHFDATTLPSGIYIYKIQAGKFFDMKKMILMK